jgi:hypothetical protein
LRGTAPLVCTVGRLKSGATATITLTLRGVAPGQARVRAGVRPRLFDPDLSNDTVKLFTQIT